MHFTKKQFHRPLYKKFLPLRKNVQNTKKFLKFGKLKWQKFQRLTLIRRKKKFYNPVSYFLSNFKNFFSKKYKYNLQNKQRLSLYYGGLKKSYLKKRRNLVLKKSRKQSPRASIMFIHKLEARLDTVLYRTYFCHSYYEASQFISHQKIYVNNKVMEHRFFELKKGDLITLDKTILATVKSNILNAEI